MPRIRTCSSLAGKRGVPEAAAPAEKFIASVTRDGGPPALVGWHTMTTERIADHLKFAYWVPNVSGGLVTVRYVKGQLAWSWSGQEDGDRIVGSAMLSR